MNKWKFSEFSNYNAEILDRISGDKYIVDRYGTNDYSRLIIRRERATGLLGEVENIDLDDLTSSDIGDIDIDEIFDNDISDLDWDGIDISVLDEKEYKDENEFIKSLKDDTRIVDTEDTYTLKDKSEEDGDNEIPDLETEYDEMYGYTSNPNENEEDLVDTLMQDFVGEFEDINIERKGEMLTDRGLEVIYDSLDKKGVKDKFKIKIKYEHGDSIIVGKIMEYINIAVSKTSKLNTIVREDFAWSSESGRMTTMEGVMDKTYQIKNYKVVDREDIEGKLLNKQVEWDDALVTLEFKNVRNFSRRDKLFDNAYYSKTITPELNKNKKILLGTEHRAITVPPVEYFESFLNLNYIRKANYMIVDDPVELKAISNYMRSSDPEHLFSYDIESTGLRFHRRISPDKKDVVVSHSFSWEDNQSIIIPVRMKNRKNIPPEVFKEYMGDILETKRILCHNGAADTRFLIEEGIDLNLKEDTYHLAKHIMPYLQVDETTGKSKSRSRTLRSLEHLVRRMDGVDLINLNRYVFRPLGIDFDFSILNDDYLIWYGCPDTDRARILWQHMRPKLEQRQEMAYRATVEFSKIMAEKSTYEGIGLSKEIIIEGRAKAKSTVDYLRRTTLLIAGETEETLDIGSNKQVAAYIYGKMGVPVTARTKRTNKGELAADKNVLDSLIKEKLETPVDRFKKDILDAEGEVLIKKEALNEMKYPEIAVLRMHNDINKDLTAYYDGLLRNSIDNIYHPEPRIGATATWRTTERTQITKSRIKNGLGIYDSEHYTVSLDYAAEELRLAGNQSDDDNLKNILQDPENDPHTSAAADLFDLELYQVTSDLRGKAKACNFGIIYGMAWYTLGTQMFKTEFLTQEQEVQAREVYALYTYKYSAMIEKLREGVKEVQKTGYIYNNLGYKMIYDEVLDIDAYEEQVFDPNRKTPPEVILDPVRMREYGGSIKNKAGNFPIQSWAAGILMLVVIKFAKVLKEHGIYDKVAIPMTVHDEVDIIVHQSVDPYLILKIMQEVFSLKMEYLKKRTVPLFVGIGFGHSWGEAKEDNAEIPVNLQNILIKEYEDGVNPKNIPATDVPKHFEKRIRDYMTERFVNIIPKTMESGVIETGYIVDQTRQNMFVLKKCSELFKIYNSKTYEYDYDKIRSLICSYDPSLVEDEINIIHTEPTPPPPPPNVNSTPVEFFHNIMVHNNIIVLGDDLLVDTTGLNQIVTGELVKYIAQFRIDPQELDDYGNKKQLVVVNSKVRQRIDSVYLNGLPLTAGKVIDNILSGAKAPTIQKLETYTDDIIPVSEFIDDTNTKTVLNLDIFPKSILKDRLDKVMTILEPHMLLRNKHNGVPMYLKINGEEIDTNRNIQKLSFDVKSKVFDLIQ